MAFDFLRQWTYASIGREISRVTRYADRVIQVDPLQGDRGTLRDAIEAPMKTVASSNELPTLLSCGADDRTVLIFNGNFNYSTDIQGLLADAWPHLNRFSRIVAVVYNPYLAWLYRLADLLGLRDGPECVTFVTRTDLLQLARLAGFEVVRLRPVTYLPWHFFGLGTLLNLLMPAVPGLRWISLVCVVVLRPVRTETGDRPSLTVVIPARNERGNIENALQRLPALGARTEVIFVEGHSSDGTWEEIERVRARWDGVDGRRVCAFQQQGTGKADAVRLGFAKATGDVLTVLDADLTMPPEDLPRFYEAYRRGLADFVNGTRLVYPIEGQAMQFLNRVANVFFAKAVSYVLEVRLGDTLCGTKLLARRDYERFVRWRSDFGDFDPFGDFELLFPAAVLGLGIIDVPVYYRARTYGSTNIRRFRDGLGLLRMVVTGFLRIRLGKAGTGQRQPPLDDA